MKYLPITLIATLSASLAVALFFTPTLGALLGKAAPVPHDERVKDAGPTCARCSLRCAIPARRWRSRRSCWSPCRSPMASSAAASSSSPSVEPDYGQVIVHARGNLSLDEKDRLVARGRAARAAVRRASRPSTPASASSRAAWASLPRTPSASSSSSSPTGSTRPPAHEIMDAIRDKTADIPGILVEVTAPRAGPPTGKPIQVQLSALDPALLPAAAQKVAAMLRPAQRHPRPRRRPAAARHRLEDRGRQGARPPNTAPASTRSAARCSSSPMG